MIFSNYIADDRNSQFANREDKNFRGRVCGGLKEVLRHMRGTYKRWCSVRIE